MIYIKVTLPGFDDNGYIDTPENVKKIIDELVATAEDGGFDESYEFRAVEMSSEEFDALPEFTGF